MLDFDTKKTYGITSAILAWLVFFSMATSLVLALLWMQTSSADPERLSQFNSQASATLITGLLVLLRLIWWLVNPTPDAPRKMPTGAYRLSRIVQLSLYLSVLAACVGSLCYGFATGHSINLFGLFLLQIPIDLNAALAETIHHYSLLCFAAVLALYCLVFLYHGRRYKMGLRRMLPGLHL